VSWHQMMLIHQHDAAAAWLLDEGSDCNRVLRGARPAILAGVELVSHCRQGTRQPVSTAQYSAATIRISQAGALICP
jgi:hypothetical protein